MCWTTMAAGRPARRAAAATVAGVGSRVRASTSTRTGRRPACRMGATAPQKVRLGVSTAAPGASRSARTASSIAAVPDDTTTT